MFHFKKKISSFAKITKVDRFIKTTQNISTNVVSHKLLDHTTAGKKGRSTPASGGRIPRFPACRIRRLKEYPDGSASTARVYFVFLLMSFVMPAQTLPPFIKPLVPNPHWISSTNRGTFFYYKLVKTFHQKPKTQVPSWNMLLNGLHDFPYVPFFSPQILPFSPDQYFSISFK